MWADAVRDHGLVLPGRWRQPGVGLSKTAVDEVRDAGLCDLCGFEVAIELPGFRGVVSVVCRGWSGWCVWFFGSVFAPGR